MNGPAAFISYSRDDSEFALQIARDLKAAGAHVWLDQLDIQPGQRWARAVQEAMTRSPRFLVVLSPSSVQSTNVEDEVSFALEEKKTVIPVLYRDCKVPFQLRPFQFADFRTDYARGLKSLLSTVRDVVAEEAVPAVAATVEQALRAEQAQADEDRRREAESARIEEQRKQAAEDAKLEEERLQEAEAARREEERQAAEAAKLKALQRKAVEYKRAEEERKEAAKLEAAEAAKLEAKRRKAAEDARLVRERKAAVVEKAASKAQAPQMFVGKSGQFAGKSGVDASSRPRIGRVGVVVALCCVAIAAGALYWALRSAKSNAAKTDPGFDYNSLSAAPNAGGSGQANQMVKPRSKANANPPNYNALNQATNPSSLAIDPSSVPERVNVSSGVMTGNLLEPIQPVYPPIARAARVHGTVILDAIISKSGMVEKLTVVSGPPMLRQSAVDAVSKASYRPYLLNGQPTEVETTVNVVYRLAE